MTRRCFGIHKKRSIRNTDSWQRIFMTRKFMTRKFMTRKFMTNGLVTRGRLENVRRWKSLNSWLNVGVSRLWESNQLDIFAGGGGRGGGWSEKWFMCKSGTRRERNYHHSTVTSVSMSSKSYYIAIQYSLKSYYIAIQYTVKSETKLDENKFCIKCAGNTKYLKLIWLTAIHYPENNLKEEQMQWCTVQYCMSGYTVGKQRTDIYVCTSGASVSGSVLPFFNNNIFETVWPVRS